MLTLIFVIAVFVLSFDVFIAGTVVGFLQKKTDLSQLFKLQTFLGFFCSVMFLVGMTIGKTTHTYFSQWSSWYASTILFLLALKLLYDGLRLHKLRQSINPTDKKGLIAITAMVSINTIFTGVAFGLLNIAYVYNWYPAMVFILAVSLGYFAGFKMKKLISLRVELFSALIFFLLAIVIAIKF